MALPKQTIPITFFGGLDTKTDPKQTVISSFLNLENALFTNPGSLTKRNGLKLLTNTIDYTEGKILQGQALSTFKDQLVLFTGTNAYSRLSHNETWNKKGQVSSVINKSMQIVSNGYSQINPDANKIDGTELYVFQNESGGLYYSVVDSDTGNFIVSDQLLSSNGKNAKVMTLEEEIGSSAQFVIFWQEDNALLCARLNTQFLTISPTIETIGSNVNCYDATISRGILNNGPSQTIFNRIFVTYDDIYETGYPIVKAITATSINTIFLDPTFYGGTPRLLSIVAAPDTSDESSINTGPVPYILWFDTADQLWIGRVNLSVGTMQIQQMVLPFDFEASRLDHLAWIWDQKPFSNQITFKMFFQFHDLTNSPTLAYCRAADIDIQLLTASITAGQWTNQKLKKGIGLYSKPFIYNNNVYITCVHESELQSVYFVTNDSLEVVSKANPNNAGGLRDTTINLCEVFSDSEQLQTLLSKQFATLYELSMPISNGVVNIPMLKRTKIESENNTIFSLFGVVRVSCDFVSTNHFLSSNINDNLYVIGGVLQNYDGNKFTEAGFHLYPENIQLSTSTFNVRLESSATPINQLWVLDNIVSGNRIRPGDYLLIVSGDGLHAYTLWFLVDGMGNDPQVPNTVSIVVPISSYFTANQIRDAIISNITAHIPEAVASYNSSDNTIQINMVNAGNLGAVITNIGQGNITPGIYLYTAVWKYIDNAGRIHRSATAIPVSIFTQTSGSVSVTVPLLSPTAKDNVILEVYRSEDEGVLFRRVTSLNNPVFNIQNSDPDYTSVTFIDTLSDTQAQANELLYTTGAVLDNDSPPSCSLITVYSNRLFIAGLDDKNTIQYTKIIDPSDINFVAGFSDYLTIQLDTRGGDITALATMDDKLVVFKDTQIFYLSGDGPTNTGEGGFGSPQQISTDVGCNNPNSVVLTPNGLMFSSTKGIYLLDRGMNVSYIGNAVEQYNTLEISSSVLINEKNQVRFMTENGKALIYDYYIKQWTTFTNYQSVDCDIWHGEFVLLRSNGSVFQEDPTSFKDQVTADTYQHVSLSAETANIKTSLLGFQRCYRIMFLGEYKGTHQLKLSLAYNFSPVPTDVVNFNATDIVGSNFYGSSSPYGNEDVYGGDYEPYYFRAHLMNQKCTSLRIKFEDLPDGEPNEALTVSGIFLQVGIKSDALKMSYDKSTGSTK